MFETTSLLVYTLFYFLVATCFIIRTTEFVSNGLTVENLLDRFIVKEYDDFVLHHIQLTECTTLIHSSLPLVYLVSSQFVASETSIVRVYFCEFLCMTLVPIIRNVVLMIQSKPFNNWSNHPIVVNLSRYNPTNWKLEAENIATEFRRIDKLTLPCGLLSRTVVTQNWILGVNSYKFYVAKKSESSFIVHSSDSHTSRHDGNWGSVQYINIQVIPIRSQIKWFFIRIKTEDFKTLEEHIGQPIQIANNVKLQRSRTERFIEVFRDQVSKNPVFKGYNRAELVGDACAGCLVNPPDVKLTKCCENSADNDVVNCTSCQCRPMWCVDCMAKWYESRQPQNDTTMWLSSKCTCPLCRQVFCILDVCPLENTDLARAI